MQDPHESPSQQRERFARYWRRALRKAGVEIGEGSGRHSAEQVPTPLKTFSREKGILYQTIWTAATGRSIPRDESIVDELCPALGITGDDDVFVALLEAARARMPGRFAPRMDPLINTAAASTEVKQPTWDPYYRDRIPVIVTEVGYYYVAADGSIGTTQDADPELGDTWTDLREFMMTKASEAPFEVAVCPDWKLPMSRRVRRELEHGFDLVEENLAKSLDLIRAGSAEQSWLYEVFPPRYCLQVNREICMKFQAFLPRVRVKALGYVPFTLEFRAEELLAHWVSEEAAANVRVRQGMAQEELDLLVKDIADFDERIHRGDMDFLMLYNDELDGAELDPSLGVGPMGIESWFEPLM